MKEFKRISIAIFFILVLSFCLTACNKHTTIVWKVYGSTNQQFLEIWQNEMNKLLEEKGKNYSVAIETYDESIYADSRTTVPIDALVEMRDNKEPADLITTDTTGLYQLFTPSTQEYSIYVTTYFDAVQKGLLLPLNDYLESTGRQKLSDALMPECLNRYRVNGCVYGIAQRLNYVTATAYNKELLEKYNINVSELSAEPFENIEVIQRVYDSEKSDSTTFAAYVSGLDAFSLGQWTLDDFEPIMFDSAKDKFVNKYHSDEFLKQVESLYALKEQGLACARSDTFDNFFAMRTFLVKNGEVFEYSLSFTDTQQKLQEKEVVVIPNMAVHYTNMYNNGYATGIASWSEHADIAIDFLTLLYTDPEMANLVQYGTEDKNYTVENGCVIPMMTYMWNDTGYNFTNELITLPGRRPLLNMKDADDKRAYMEEYFASEPEMPIGFHYNLDTVQNEITAISDYIDNDTSYAFLCRLNITDWRSATNEMNRQLYDLGLQRVVDELNRQYTEWKSTQAKGRLE